MIFKLGTQYNQWLAKRKPTDIFEWGRTATSSNSPIEHVIKRFEEMDEEEKEAAFRRAVFIALSALVI